jgi:hypothetical protein
MDSKEYTLESFIDKMLEDQQFTGLDSEVRAQLHSDLLSRAEDYINAALLMALSDEDRKEFEQLVEKNSEAGELQTFLNTHIENPSEVVAAALIKFREAYIEA